MAQTIHLDYPRIYREIGELKNLVHTEIDGKAKQSRQEAIQVAETMPGRTNEPITQNLWEQCEKAGAVSTALFAVLEFMEHSAREMEKLDGDLAKGIEEGQPNESI